MNKILVIIPARSGSKGIKNKNIIRIKNKPLIFYTINPALKIKKEGLVEDVIISTDSPRIVGISRKMGATVPFLRPRNISGDKAKSIDFILHAVSFFEKKGVFYSDVVLLQPTSPLRKYEDIKGAINLYIKNKNHSLISAYQESGITENIIYIKKRDRAIPVLVNHGDGKRRQDSNNIFVRNGAIYIVSVEYLKKFHKIISDNPLLFEMPKQRSLNLDSREDLKELRNIL